MQYFINNYHTSSKVCQGCHKPISLEEYLNAPEYMCDNEVLCDECYSNYVNDVCLYFAYDDGQGAY